MKEVLKEFGGTIIGVVVITITLALIFGGIYTSSSGDGIYAAIKDKFEDQKSFSKEEQSSYLIKNVYSTGFKDNVLLIIQNNKEYKLNNLIKINSVEDIILYEIVDDKGENVTKENYNQKTNIICFDQAGMFNIKYKVISSNGYSELHKASIYVE